ncbi:ATP-grasp domain-containing protein [Serpentinicella sp. ANB-PHB4]|uniref:ATP-grasp domain-containing protein n=1 Tax=Serpentinicella sp. ANB-PHB4 TaxID=3074076 RepID=UPI00286444DE|nr:ATP-grasp domain-containing protein [Serpentinicella sp. ANB-PHB4]MDR5658565.1 ATP-grasp domain-containing protein [Serpentinicella sp. ANB-PHB4]
MKVAIIYNRESQAVINLFGIPNREKYGLSTIKIIKDAIKSGGHQVKTFEGDKNIIRNLEEFMPSVISGERPGLVFNLSYGIQGKGRYMHVPSILEMLGIPYIGSSPETHGIALDKVITKMILIQKGLPTPKFAVLEEPNSIIAEDLKYPLIVKPKNEAVSFGLRIAYNEEELREGVQLIYDTFKSPTLVEEYIEGKEVNVGLIGNDPIEALPPVELDFGEGLPIYTFEDKKSISGRTVEKICPARLSEEQTKQIQHLAIETFKALGCYDSARVDLRIDAQGNPYILEVNSMASLGKSGSYVYAAENVGLNYNKLINRLIDVATERYFGTTVHSQSTKESKDDSSELFHYLTKNRDRMEEELKHYTNISSRTDDPVGLSTILRKLDGRLSRLGLKPSEQYTNGSSSWTWETKAGFKDGTLLVLPIDIPGDKGGYPVPFRREQEWLFGEGIASTRAGMILMLQAFDALRSIKQLHNKKIGVFLYSDEGREMRYSNQAFKQASEEANQVIVLQPGYKNGKVVDQRRGLKKYSILVEGNPQRIGNHNNQLDVLSYFINNAQQLKELSSHNKKTTVSVQDVHTERYSILLPHRVRATVCVTFIDQILADEIEDKIKDTFKVNRSDARVFIEKLAERPPLIRNKKQQSIIIEKLFKLSEDWKLPFGYESGLLSSAAGSVPWSVPVICGFGPVSQGLFTPNEAVHRGELLQRTLLLSLFLLNE